MDFTNAINDNDCVVSRSHHIPVYDQIYEETSNRAGR